MHHEELEAPWWWSCFRQDVGCSLRPERGRLEEREGVRKTLVRGGCLGVFWTVIFKFSANSDIFYQILAKTLTSGSWQWHVSIWRKCQHSKRYNNAFSVCFLIFPKGGKTRGHREKPSWHIGEKQSKTLLTWSAAFRTPTFSSRARFWSIQIIFLPTVSALNASKKYIKK